MDKWAERFFGRATFVCVGCDGSALAETFASNLRLTKTTITYVDKRNGPKWGQLGCQGFIILDGSGSVVCKTTPPFMEIEQLAFRYVESVVGALMDKKPLPSVLPGQMVHINGLTGAPELNGSVGTCVSAEGENGRCQISMRGRGVVSVKPANLTVHMVSRQYTPEGGGGCGGGGCSGGGGCDDADVIDACDAGGGGGCDGGGCGGGGCNKAGCSDQKATNSAVDAAIAKLREATNTLYHSAEPLPARMVKSLQAKVEAAKEELELLVEATMEDLEPPQLEAAVAAIASAMPSVDDLKEVPNKKAKAEASKPVAPVGAIHSVKVAELDDEHEICSAALDELARAPTRLALERVIKAYEGHFAHEESLLDTHLYADAASGKASNGFSAEASKRKTHYADHTRMLKELNTMVESLPSETAAVPSSFCDKVLRDFENHANKFDMYGDELAAKLAAA